MIRPLAHDVLTLAAAQAGVALHDLVSGSTRRLAHARQRAMYVIHRLRPDMSRSEIGRRMGGRDHTTVLHGLLRAEARAALDPREAALIADLTARALQGAAAVLDIEIEKAEASLADLRRRRAAWEEQVTA